MYFIIYKITNLVTGKIYIGQSTNDLKIRWKSHCSKSSKVPYLSRAIKKYKIENFTIEIIDWATNQTELNYKEWLWICKLDCIAPNGYNLKQGGKNGGKWSEEYKLYMTNRGFFNRGKPWNKGQKCPSPSQDTLIKRSIAMKGRKPWNANKKMPVRPLDWCMKISSSKKGITPSENTLDACRRKVYCNENQKSYNSIMECLRDLKLGIGGTSNIAKQINGKIKHYKGYTFKYIDGK